LPPPIPLSAFSLVFLLTPQQLQGVAFVIPDFAFLGIAVPFPGKTVVIPVLPSPFPLLFPPPQLWNQRPFFPFTFETEPRPPLALPVSVD